MQVTERLPALATRASWRPGRTATVDGDLADVVEVAIEQHWIEGNTDLPQPDPRWRHTDAAGHEHTTVDGRWPTLDWVVDEVYWCEECRDNHEDGHYRCARCGEAVDPGTIVDRTTRIRGLSETTLRVRGRSFQPDQEVAIAFADSNWRGVVVAASVLGDVVEATISVTLL
jgi:hypothetical protein